MAKLGEIDVCIPTLKPLSKESISNIKDNIQVNRVLTSALKGRGNARQDLVNRVETEWFAFIDADVVLYSNWQENLSKYISDDIGAVEGLWTYGKDRRVKDFTDSMVHLARLSRRKSWKERSDFRAFTGDTLIRTSAVKDIKIPNINVFEDQFIQDHIKNKGLKWVRTRETVCNHVRPYNIEEAYESGRYGYYFGKLDPTKQLERLLFLTILKVIFCLFDTGNLAACHFELRKQYEIWRGVTHAHVQGWKYVG